MYLSVTAHTESFLTLDDGRMILDFARDKHKDCCNGHLITAREYDRITEREGVSEKLQRRSTNLSRVSEV